MNAIETTTPASLSERLNQTFQSITVRARGPCSVRADDLVFDLSPTLDFREPHHRRLFLSGGLKTTRRPACVRVILSVEGKFHPYCDAADVWCIEDLGLIELGGKIDIDLVPEATFQLAFAEHSQTSAQVPVGEQVLKITLPNGEQKWSCGNPVFAIAADPDIPTLALLQTTRRPMPVPEPILQTPPRLGGRIPLYMLGGGANREPLKISLPLADCPLGLVRVQCWTSEGLTGKQVLSKTLWAVFKSRGNNQMLETEIPAHWIGPSTVNTEPHWEATAVTDKDLDTNDLADVQNLLSDPLVLSSHFPSKSRERLQKWLAESEQKAR